MDGFVSVHREDGLEDLGQVMSYYDDGDIPYFWNVADEYVLIDRHVTLAHGGSVSNHMYWVAGTPGAGKGDTIPAEGFSGPTNCDRLEAVGVIWQVYVENHHGSVNLRNRGNGDRAAQGVSAPVLNRPRFLDTPALFEKIDEYYEDLESGMLPAVAFIVPSGASEHPPGSVRVPEFVRTLRGSLMRSSAWSSSALFWTTGETGTTMSRLSRSTPTGSASGRRHCS